MTCHPAARGSTSGLRKASRRFCWYGARRFQNGMASTPPMTFAAMITMLSHTYGRHQSSKAVSVAIHTPQATVEKASTSPMTGEEASSNSEGFVPAQNSMKNRMATKTMALPRSGCFRTSRQGMPAMRAGARSEERRVGKECREGGGGGEEEEEREW